MQHDHVLKNLNFDLLIPHTRVLQVGGLRAKYLLPCCCIHVSLQFDMQHDHVLAFDILTGPPALGEGGDLRANYLLPCCCNSWFHSISPIDPIPRVLGERFCEQNICCHVAAFVILFNLICTMTISWKSWTLTYWPHSQGRGCLRQNICYRVFCICDSL